MDRRECHRRLVLLLIHCCILLHSHSVDTCGVLHIWILASIFRHETINSYIYLFGCAVTASCFSFETASSWISSTIVSMRLLPVVRLGSYRRPLPRSSRIFSAHAFAGFMVLPFAFWLSRSRQPNKPVGAQRAEFPAVGCFQCFP